MQQYEADASLTAVVAKVWKSSENLNHSWKSFLHLCLAESSFSFTLLMYLCNEPRIDEATQEPENCKDMIAWGEIRRLHLRLLDHLDHNSRSKN